MTRKLFPLLSLLLSCSLLACDEDQQLQGTPGTGSGGSGSASGAGGGAGLGGSAGVGGSGAGCTCEVAVDDRKQVLACGQSRCVSGYTATCSGTKVVFSEGCGTAGAGGQGGASGGVQIRIHVTATTAPFAHTDGLSGQTPIDHRAGLRSYRLFKDAADTVGIKVFDLGNDFVEVSYNDKADTIVATVPLDSLPEGTYTRGELVHTHVRYKVNATAHLNGFTAPGTFDNLQVMSNNTTLDGTTYQSGHYRYVFEAAGMTFPKEGEGAPIPEQTSLGGFGVKSVNGQWIYEFPSDVTIVHGLTTDVDTYMELNMHESFRWQDQDSPGYSTGVFDVTSTSFEPVKQFGANSFKVTLKE